MQIFAQTVAGKTIPLEVDADDTMQDVKAKLQAEQGIPSEEQSLMFSENQLEDGNPLANYHNPKMLRRRRILIIHGAVLTVVALLVFHGFALHSRYAQRT
ncbi:ubiquitin C [Limtongia smithiae]|uniref:ubiquitin C n=1 Tax=Limtongia smithiae TaxID=1125753 RepID=UPI0034D01383